MNKRLSPFVIALVSLGTAGPDGSLAERVLPWLPADTESIFVSNSPFDLVRTVPRGLTERDYLGLAASGLPAGPAGGPFAAIEGLRVRAALYAGRRLRMVNGKTGLGLYASMGGCSVLELSAEGSNLVVEQALHRLPRELDAERGIAVLSQAATEGGDPSAKTYLTLVNAQLLFSCSEKEFLLETLDRMQHGAIRAALPDSLPEWRWVRPAGRRMGTKAL